MIEKFPAKRDNMEFCSSSKLAASGSFCPLRGMLFLLDSGLRRNDGLMDYLG